VTIIIGGVGYVVLPKLSILHYWRCLTLVHYTYVVLPKLSVALLPLSHTLHSHTHTFTHTLSLTHYTTHTHLCLIWSLIPDPVVLGCWLQVEQGVILLGWLVLNVVCSYFNRVLFHHLAFPFPVLLTLSHAFSTAFYYLLLTNVRSSAVVDIVDVDVDVDGAGGSATGGKGSGGPLPPSHHAQQSQNQQ